MVVALGPGKFYGSTLPRPRFYTDVKFSSERVDPPVPVMDPLLQWAHEAHWSMGGLSFRRLRLQGRIEGSIKNLRADRERRDKKLKKMMTSPSSRNVDDVEIGSDSDESESEPETEVAATRVLSRTRSQKKQEVMTSAEVGPSKLGRKRKLIDEFEKVAEDKAGQVLDRVRVQRSEPVVRRTSPRKKSPVV